MDRRRFLQLLAASGAAPFAAAAADGPFAGFRAALRSHPWLAAYRGLDTELECPALVVEGRIPPRLRGTLYRNGPAMMERGGVRYRHLFDGDGMVQAFRFSDAGVSHLGRFVRTPKFEAEARLGRFAYPAFGTPAAGAEFANLARPDSFNVANTNVVAHGGRLYALWEGGSAWELDPATLDTIGPITWREDLRSAPFSAHPKIEPDGTMWNMGAGPNALMIYRIDPAGRLAHAELVRVPGLVMNHDFAVSERHLVCVLPELGFDARRLEAGLSFVEAMEIPRGAPLRMLVVDKADLSKRRWFELPPGFLFHFGNAWDDGAVLRFDYVHHEDASILTEGLAGMMRGEASALRDRRAVSTHVAIDLASGAVRTQRFDDIVEFPRVDPRRTGLRNRHLWHVASVATGAGTLHPNAVVRYDLESGARDLYRYGDGTVVEEHIPVPDADSPREGSGWLLGCTFEVATGRTHLNIFDATRVSDGPIARARLPYGLPLGFHGNWA